MLGQEVTMSRYSPAKRAKELRRKAKHEAKEVRKKERRESSGTAGADDDIDWSQAVGLPRPEGAEGEGNAETEDGAADGAPEDGE
jgi:hypothetical protein